MWLGEFDVSSLVDFKFTTRGTTGAPTTLAGTPAISVYKANSTTESTAGVTLTADFDSRTGLNHVRIDTSADGTFYATATDFQVVVTTGTVGGTSVVGEVVGHFSLRNRAALKPTTAGRTLDVAATGEAGLDFDNIKDATGAHTLTNVTVPLVTTVTGNVNGSVGSVTGAVGSVTGSVGSVTGAVGSVTGTVGSVTGNVGGNVVGSVASVTGNVGGNVVGSVGSLTTNNDKTGYSLTTLESFVLHSGTAQAGAASTITLAAGASAADDLYKSQVIKVYSGTGAGQSRIITGYVGATKVATVDRAWATQPDATSLYAVLAMSEAKLNASLEVVSASVTGDVGGNITGNLGDLSVTAKASVKTQLVNALTVDTYAEPAAAVAATATLKDMLNWMKALARNKMTQTATTQTLRNDGDAATIASSTDSDDGTTFTRGKWV